MDFYNKADEHLADEIKFLQVRITELEKSESRHKLADELLRKTELQQEAILNNIPDIAWLKDRESRYIVVNEAFGRACGVKPKELIGKTDLDIWPRELAQRYRADDQEVMESGKCKCVEEPLANKEGKISWIETIKTPIYNDKREVIGTTGIARDITERKKHEERLREARVELEIRVKVRTAELSRTNEELKKDEFKLIKLNEKLKELSLIDSHTGLYNHRYLVRVIEAEFHRARRYAYPLAVIMLDIDYFKSINDVYGHQFGDLVLKQFARQLKTMVRIYDIIIRFTGEEFIVISPSIDRQQTLILSQRILESLNLYNFGDKKHKVKLKISMGVVSFPEDRVTNGIDLINSAEEILNKAKESGGNRVYLLSDIRKGQGVISGIHDKAPDIKFLKVKIDKLNKKANQSLTEAILAFAKTIELKDHYTGEHVEITGHYTTLIANKLGLPKDEVELIHQASMLHDLGKIGISEKILLKKSKLTRREFDEIKRHPQIGADILRPIHFLRGLIPFILYHHERWDGKGYPSGIKGEEIPIGARIIALADVYQALTSDRPYRKAYSKAKALSIIKAGAGTQFDSRITNIFLKILQEEK